jgi:hypothetical protein
MAEDQFGRTNQPAERTPAATPPPPSPLPPSESEEDWTAEDPATDKAKAPIEQRDPAYWTDVGFFRLVILSVGGMLLLAANDKEIPHGIVATASGLVGLLTGIFAAKTGRV